MLLTALLALSFLYRLLTKKGPSMNPEDMQGEKDWDGVEQREIRRRYLIDRRVTDKRKRYMWSVVFPIILGSILTALISWGVFVTHTTYRISASYEETFVKHIEREIEKDLVLEHRLDMIKADFTNRMDTMSADTKSGFAEIRTMQTAMYQLLLETERHRNGDKGIRK